MTVNVTACSSVSAIHYPALIHPSYSEKTLISCLASTWEGGLFLMEVTFVVAWCDWLNWQALIEQCCSSIWVSIWVWFLPLLFLWEVKCCTCTICCAVSGPLHKCKKILKYWDRDMLFSGHWYLTIVCKARLGCLRPSSDRNKMQTGWSGLWSGYCVKNCSFTIMLKNKYNFNAKYH